jgi:hypothetical protein
MRIDYPLRYKGRMWYAQLPFDTDQTFYGLMILHKRIDIDGLISHISRLDLIPDEKYGITIYIPADLLTKEEKAGDIKYNFRFAGKTWERERSEEGRLIRLVEEFPFIGPLICNRHKKGDEIINYIKNLNLTSKRRYGVVIYIPTENSWRELD